MLLRATLVILFMLNLGAAAWWGLRPSVADARGAEANAAGATGLRLVNEPAVATAPTRAQPAPAGPAPVASMVPAATSVVAAPASAPVCLRFGPFADGTARDAARNALMAAGVSAVTRDSRMSISFS